MKKTTLPLILVALVVAPLTIIDVDARGSFGSRAAEAPADTDGTISDVEKQAAKAARYAARETARQAFIDEHDTDGDGELSDDEKAAAKAAREAAREEARAAREEARQAFIDEHDTDQKRARNTCCPPENLGIYELVFEGKMHL